jgi:hypothetical protein
MNRFTDLALNVAFALVVAAFLVIMLAANWRGWPQLIFIAGIVGLTWLWCLEAKQRRWLNAADREEEAHDPVWSKKSAEVENRPRTGIWIPHDLSLCMDLSSRAVGAGRDAEVSCRREYW